MQFFNELTGTTNLKHLSRKVNVHINVFILFGCSFGDTVDS